MNALPPPVPPAACWDRRDDRIRGSIRQAMAYVRPSHGQPGQRRDVRVAYPYPVRLTPFDDRGQPDESATFFVVGKQLAERGLDFYHRDPLPQRRVVASLHCGPDCWLDFVLQLTWCRFCCHGWYESGGRFRQAFHQRNLPGAEHRAACEVLHPVDESKRVPVLRPLRGSEIES